jgi:hypothetical protein
MDVSTARARKNREKIDVTLEGVTVPDVIRVVYLDLETLRAEHQSSAELILGAQKHTTSTLSDVRWMMSVGAVVVSLTALLSLATLVLVVLDMVGR